MKALWDEIDKMKAAFASRFLQLKNNAFERGYLVRRVKDGFIVTHRLGGWQGPKRGVKDRAVFAELDSLERALGLEVRRG